jgi:hypothetical protein
MRRGAFLLLSVAAPAFAWAAPAAAQSENADQLRADLQAAKTEIAEQRLRLDGQEARIRALETRLTAMVASSSTSPNQGVSSGATTTAPVQIAQSPSSPSAGVEQVGQAPEPRIEVPQVPVLGDAGAVITRAGQFTLEPSLEYVRADRNTALFRGVSIAESVLIGIFDINESHQDLLTAAATLRYGVTSRLELSVKVPYVYRADTEVLAPIAATPGDSSQQVDTSAKGHRLGDIEFDARYQITPARVDRPFLIGTMQVVAPTGSSAFGVPRDTNGRALVAATGGGFWNVTPGVTAILPTDPGVLFGSLSYTHNFGRNENADIPPVLISRVVPGDAIGASFGIGLALNQRTSLNFGYAHSWVFGTNTTIRLLDPAPNDPNTPFVQRTRDLQIGRFLFGISYRVSDRTTINWSLEVGATQDAPDVRTTIRIPIVIP